MTPSKRVRLQLLNEATQAALKERGQILFNHLKSGTDGLILLTDEKLFTIEAKHNSQNDQILAQRADKIPFEVHGVFRKQKPTSVSVWAGVMSDGIKEPLVFVPHGVKINKETYLAMLEDKLLLWIHQNYPGSTKFTFQQDGTPAHMAKIIPRVL